MSKIQLGKWTIRTAASLRSKLLEAKAEGGFDRSLYCRLTGVYDTRLFGLVFYRNGELAEFDLRPPVSPFTDAWKNEFKQPECCGRCIDGMDTCVLLQDQEHEYDLTIKPSK